MDAVPHSVITIVDLPNGLRVQSVVDARTGGDHVYRVVRDGVVVGEARTLQLVAELLAPYQ